LGGYLERRKTGDSGKEAGAGSGDDLAGSFVFRNYATGASLGILVLDVGNRGIRYRRGGIDGLGLTGNDAGDREENDESEDQWKMHGAFRQEAHRLVTPAIAPALIFIPQRPAPPLDGTFPVSIRKAKRLGTATQFTLALSMSDVKCREKDNRRIEKSWLQDAVTD
jgi:hypothetical protein